MNLLALHSIMSEKGYHYFSGRTNDKEDNLYLDFSTLHNGRGNSVEIRIGKKDFDIIAYIQDEENSWKNIQENKLYQILNQI